MLGYSFFPDRVRSVASRTAELANRVLAGDDCRDGAEVPGHKVGLVKADGKDISAVTMAVRSKPSHAGRNGSLPSHLDGSAFFSLLLRGNGSRFFA